MNKQRIQNVIKALLETPHKDRFTMEAWAHPCGTPACAIGNYVARTDLQDEFKLQPWLRHDGSVIAMDLVDTEFGGLRGFDDLTGHFGLTEEEVEELFGFEGCGGAKTTEQAIAYLTWFISKPEFATESDSE